MMELNKKFIEFREAQYHFFVEATAKT